MKKKALTAALLTAALTLGAAPAAYADSEMGSITETTINGASGSVSTAVNIETTVSQIKAALPLTMTVAAPASGGSTAVPGGFKIVNKSTFPLKVSGATATAGSGWNLSESALAANSAPSGAIGDIQMTLTAGGAAWNVAKAFEAKTWKIPAGEKGSDGELGIAIVSTNSSLKKTFNDPQQAVTLTFTIAADGEETVQPEPTPDPAPVE